MRAALKLAITIAMASLIVWAVVGCAGGSSSSGSGTGVSTSTTLIASPSGTVSPGTAVTLTATVTVPTGFTAPTTNITFYDGSTLLGAGTCCSTSTPGGVFLTTTLTTAGAHVLTAVYSGGSGFAASTSNAVTVTVSGSGGTGGASGNPATLVYVEQTGITQQILAFAAGANGSVAPVSSLSMPSGFLIYSVATDPAGQIYVGGYLASGAAVINIYAAGASGAATPVRSIYPTNQYAPTAMCVPASGLLYTVDGDSQLSVYSATASGSVAPQRVISGTASLIGYSTGIAVDSSGNIWVAVEPVGSMPASLLMFTATATGNTAPARTIPSASNLAYLGVAVDSASNVYATLDTTTAPLSSQVLVYAGGASGSATPIKTIAGSSTGLTTAGGLEVDGAGNIFVPVQTASGSNYTYAVEEFAPTATGNATPTAVMSSTSWTAAGSEIALK